MRTGVAAMHGIRTRMTVNGVPVIVNDDGVFGRFSQPTADTLRLSCRVSVNDASCDMEANLRMDEPVGVVIEISGGCKASYLMRIVEAYQDRTNPFSAWWVVLETKLPSRHEAPTLEQEIGL